MNVYYISKESNFSEENVRQMKNDEIKSLPPFVVETLELGALAFSGDKLYGISVAHVMGTE